MNILYIYTRFLYILGVKKRKMEFSSKEELLLYERERENYYMESISAVNRGDLGKFYWLWLREIFVPKYRKLKKEYDNYYGNGWYRDEKGIIHTRHISNVETSGLNDGTICITDIDGPRLSNIELYVLNNETWIRYDRDFDRKYQEYLAQKEKGGNQQ